MAAIKKGMIQVNSVITEELTKKIDVDAENSMRTRSKQIASILEEYYRREEEKMIKSQSPLEKFIKELENLKAVQVVDYGYSVEKCWDPLIVRLNDSQLQKFIQTYNTSGKLRSVTYRVNNTDVYLQGIGNDILMMF